MLKAVTDGKIAGFLAGHHTNRFGLDAEIQLLYVLKSEQNKNIGKNLLRSFVQWLIEMQANSLCAGIHPENKYQRFNLKYAGKYLNEHWIYWSDLTSLQAELNEEQT